jgi:phosphotransferase system enzyme I (PtsI)
MKNEVPRMPRRTSKPGTVAQGTGKVIQEKGAAREILLEGLGVSAGIAIGEAHVVEIGVVNVPDYEIAADAVEPELERFREALAKSERQLRKLKKKSAELHGAAAEELEFLLAGRARRRETHP